jgi:hypothetical protein
MCGRLKPKPRLMSTGLPEVAGLNDFVPVRTVEGRIEYARWEGCARREQLQAGRLWTQSHGWEPCTLPLVSFFEGTTEVPLPPGTELRGVIKRFLDGTALCRNLTKAAATPREKEIAAYHPKPGHDRVPILQRVEE